MGIRFYLCLKFVRKLKFFVNALIKRYSSWPQFTW